MSECNSAKRNSKTFAEISPAETPRRRPQASIDRKVESCRSPLVPALRRPERTGRTTRARRYLPRIHQLILPIN